MDLRLRRPAFWAQLHLRSGLQGWDLPRELALDATCDQLPPVADEALPTARLYQAAGGPTEAPCPSISGARETAGKPHLWMWVDPNLVCPIPGHATGLPPLPGPRPRAAPEVPSCTPARFRDARPGEEVPRAVQDPGSAPEAKTTLLPKEDSQRPPHACQNAQGIQSRSRKLLAQGSWPRPPLNYCILISLALSSSVDSSLTVQEIYKFTRHHFPFFRTAPEGWKNTVRHNLCFSSSFEKTTDFVCLEGNRKSRLWKLTTEGRRKFQEEAQALPEDMMGLVHQSMDKPELMRSLFGL
ncbi:forkhead box protein R1 isoform X1 [Notechis scutatus]|uniref:Forkhead box protein R1 isoform X1 n=1 Tax=Notechis scutatus TaxID=8663 RepID=A0A6J1V0J5_9SAUR|nr:forkhead box protein R1 isoform X1 [Notechis scutatus]